MKMALRQYCIEHGRDTLLREWDAARNGGLTPSDVSFGSHQKVWWQCSKGHSWQAKVYSRSAGSGCPYCTGRKEVPENSLAVQVPSLEAEWDAEKNAPLKFADLTIGSHKKVWWRCPAGHSYDSVVKSRVLGTGCPVCAGRVVLPDENSLAARYPALVARAAGLLAGGGDLLADLARGHQMLGEGHAVILQKDDLQSPAAQRIAVDLVRQRIDEVDDALGDRVARRGLRAEEEGPRLQLHARIVLQFLVQINDVHGVEQLTLVLMQALDLHVKDGVGVERHALRLFDVGGKVELVGALDLVQPREHRTIAGEGLELLELLGMEQIAAPAAEVGNQAVEPQVDLREPAAPRRWQGS